MSARPMMILDSSGRPFRMVAHEAASRTSNELASWNASLLSADAAWLPEREQIVARTQDIIRNNGIASGAVQIHLDNVIGAGLQLSAKPDAEALGLTEDQAAELEGQLETKWRQWAYDIDCYCDAARTTNFCGLLSQSYRSYLTQFEILATGEWLPGRSPYAYATAIQIVDPNRLSTPQGMSDNDVMRAGVEFDAMGAPIAYHVSTEHTISPFLSNSIMKWTRIPRETSWGRTRVIHIFDIEQPGQSRGKNGIVSVLSKLKMLERFEKATLQAAILNAVYAAFIKSPLDWASVGAGIGVVDSDQDPTRKYLEQRMEFHQESKIRVDGVQVPHLYPGEEFEFQSAKHPTAAFEAFESAVLRFVASGFGLTYEQLARDYSKTNYSSARAAMLEAWRFFHGKQQMIAGRFARLVYALWLEEAIDRGDIKLPAGAPSFYEAKTAYCRSEWIGPGRGHIDPLKEANADKVRYSMGITTLEELCAQQGRDWREVLKQRREEERYMRSLGMDPASLNGPTPVPQPPDAPERETEPDDPDAADRREREEAAA